MKDGPKCQYTILCDDIRREDNGKLIIIGMYLPDMVAPQIPFVAPQLVFFQMFEWPQQGQFSLRSKLECISAEGVSNVANGLALVPVLKAGLGVHAIRLGNINIQRTGDYVFRVFYESDQEPVCEHKFKVYLPPVQH